MDRPNLFFADDRHRWSMAARALIGKLNRMSPTAIG
jgi:hypothetical protein